MHLNGRFSSERELREKLDFIYEKSKSGSSFYGILEVASNEVTIITAIHAIKSNSGANTAGVDRRKMDRYLQMDRNKLISLVQSAFQNYQPKPARRVYIQKSNGKQRPLGIPTVLDRMAGLMIQNLSRELFSIANDNDGKLKKRVVFYCDEFGTMPPFDVLPLFSAGRSHKLTLVPIIQSLAQLEKNYGKEGAEIIADNCQDTIFGGFAPNSQTAETLSKALGSRTVLTGSISKGKDSNSQSLQMAERALLSPDELKSLPKGEFVVMKTGTHPMRTKLQLYFKWGIKFEEPYQTPERAQREVYYAGKEELLMNIKRKSMTQMRPPAVPKADDYMSSYGEK